MSAPSELYSHSKSQGFQDRDCGRRRLRGGSGWSLRHREKKVRQSCVCMCLSHQGMKSEWAALLSFIQRHLTSYLDPHCLGLVHLYVRMAMCDKDHRSKNPYLEWLSPEGRRGLAEASVLALYKFSNTLILTENIKPNIILTVLNRREQQPQG